MTSTHEQQASAWMARWLLQARRSAVRRRLQVGQVGWALLVYGILPGTILPAAGFPIDKVVGDREIWHSSVVLGSSSPAASSPTPYR